MKSLLLVIAMMLLAPAQADPGLERAPVDGGYLTFQELGDGEAVLMIHGALIADTFIPVMDNPALADYRLIRYQRSGYADSASLDIAPEDFLEHAVNDAVALLDHLEVERAHLVGHSSGAVIAMALALQSSERVRSLVLLEPPMMDVPAAEALLQVIGEAGSHYEAGDSAAAVDAFLSRLAQPDWHGIDEAVPGATEQAIADAGTFFGIEAPGIGEFEFDQDRADRLTMPALYVLGSESSAIAGADGYFEQGKALLLDMLPNAQAVILEGVNHTLQIGYPERVVPVIARFIEQHPIEY
jgi:pimeloyl-ACP methyl ester carboxylesterase